MVWPQNQRQLRNEKRSEVAGAMRRGVRVKVTNVLRNVFLRLGHAIETNLVDPREQYQAALLGDPAARPHSGEYAKVGKARVPHLVGEERPVVKLSKVA
jgi:hypothetical protein